MSDELNVSAQLDLALIDLTVRGSVVLDILHDTLQALSDIGEEAADAGQLLLAEQCIAALDRALGQIRPLIHD